MAVNLRVEITDDDHNPLCEDVDHAGALPASPDTWYNAEGLCEHDSGDSHAEGDAYTGNHDGTFYLNGRTESWIDWPERGESDMDAYMSCAFTVDAPMSLEIQFHLSAWGSSGGNDGRGSLRGPSGVLSEFTVHTQSHVDYDEIVSLSAFVAPGETCHLEMFMDLYAYDNNVNQMYFEDFIYVGPTPVRVTSWRNIKAVP